MSERQSITVPEKHFDPVQIGRHVGETVLMGLLVSMTAGLFGRPAAINLTRWGWMAAALYWTYALASTKAGKQLALKFRAQYEDKPLMSYGLVIVCSALLGVFYWWGINKLYEQAFAVYQPPVTTVEPPQVVLNKNVQTAAAEDEPTPKPQRHITPRPSQPQFQQ